nr:unnamed protein product [Spirometra erinaceieuropaei]
MNPQIVPAMLAAPNAVPKRNIILVGDLILLEKNQRISADMILLWTSEPNGACFIRTDQLDGETDWKLRNAVPVTQHLVAASGNPQSLFDIQAQIYAEAPSNHIHSFEGTFARTDVAPGSSAAAVGAETESSLSVDQTLWSGTVLATGTAVGIVIYTGCETRAVMNSSKAHTKMGRIDREINNITKLLFVVVVLLALVMVALQSFMGAWYINYWRFFLLFSYIIPLALRVNMDMAKIVYSLMISRDRDLPGCVVRSTTIPEELGRVTFFLTDKTGTLTQNEMVFKKLHLGNVAFAPDSMDDLTEALKRYFEKPPDFDDIGTKQLRKSGDERLAEAVLAIAVCHNVTPMNEDTDQSAAVNAQKIDAFAQPTGYQASSPDEVALVSWTATVGVTLIFRNQQVMALRLPSGKVQTFDILQMFPFSSDLKRMGIIVRDQNTRAIHFYVKGADTVMASLVSYTPWMEDEAGNLAREGLRTLVVARRVLSEEQYADFSSRTRTSSVILQFHLTCLRYYEHETVELARQCPVVVVCRCSPTQKAGIAKLLASHTGAVIAAIGDGGNDVSMIQAAHVGIGIVGKEGRQASLASDFSITTFSHVTRLLLVHGRNCYKNTASLSQFIIHRGRELTFKTFFIWMLISIYQGSVIMYGALILFDADFIHVVSITFTSSTPDAAASVYALHPLIPNSNRSSVISVEIPSA